MVKVANERKSQRLPLDGQRQSQRNSFFFFYLFLWGHAEGLIQREERFDFLVDNSTCLEAGPMTMRDGSRELQDLLNRTSFAAEQDRAQRREIIQTYTAVQRADDFWLEVTALSQHRADGSVIVTMYGLQQQHLDTRTRRVIVDRAGGMWYFVQRLRDAWIDIIPHDTWAEFIMIDKQLPHYMTGGDEILHVIFDAQPWMLTIAYVALIIEQEEGPIDEEVYEIRAARGMDTMLCEEHFRSFGHLESCREPLVRCRCDEDNNFDVRLFQDTLIALGKRINLLLERELDDQTTSNDEMSFMMLNAGRPRGRGRHFVYTADQNEPTILQNFEDLFTGLDLHQQIIQQFRGFMSDRAVEGVTSFIPSAIEYACI